MQSLFSFNDLCTIINQSAQAIQKPLFIGVCGLSGSGKTYTAKRIADYFGARVHILSLDLFAYPTADRKTRIMNALEAGQEDDILKRKIL